VDAGDPRGKLCRLSWRALEGLGTATLVEVQLETGFLHQVRAIFAAMGHPLLGDALYADGAGAQRPMLHAQSIRWQGVAAACEPPADFAEALRRLRGVHTDMH